MVGLPAARISDMHVCPLVNPGPVPHVGGPIVLGEFTVLVGGMPQARIGDMATCTGPPDTIAMGAFNVLVGGKPAARISDITAHGGSIVTGFFTVLIGTSGAPGGGGGMGAGAGLASTMSPECIRLADAFAKAQMANDTYGEGNDLPQGTRRVTDPGKLDLLGLTPEMLDPPAHENSGFHARVYATDGESGTEYTIAFRGTRMDSGEDWASNAQQGIGLPSDHYDRAVEIGSSVRASGENVSFTGHSLGGGLASAAAVSSGNRATTFNAAGLSNNTVANFSDDPVPVDAYYTPRDPLSAVQDNRGGVLSVLAAGLGALSAGGGVLLAGYLLGRELGSSPVLPQAYGTRHELPETEENFMDRIDPRNVVEPHSMVSVLDAMEAQQQESGCI